MVVTNDDFKELKTRVTQLEKDVVHLTVWRNVVAILGVLLGISGPWVYTIVRNAIEVSTTLASIQGNLRAVEKASGDLRAAMAQTDEQLRGKADGVLREQVPKVMANIVEANSTNVVHFSDEIALAFRDGSSTRYVSFGDPEISNKGLLIGDAVSAGRGLQLRRVPVPPPPPPKKSAP